MKKWWKNIRMLKMFKKISEQIINLSQELLKTGLRIWSRNLGF